MSALSFFVGLVVGLVVGAFIGVAVMCLMRVAGSEKVEGLD